VNALLGVLELPIGRDLHAVHGLLDLRELQKEEEEEEGR